jgi:hypothetical protein
VFDYLPPGRVLVEKDVAVVPGRPFRRFNLA